MIDPELLKEKVLKEDVNDYRLSRDASMGSLLGSACLCTGRSAARVCCRKYRKIQSYRWLRVATFIVTWTRDAACLFEVLAAKVRHCASW